MKKLPFYRKITFKVLTTISLTLTLSFVASYFITTKYTDEIINSNTSKEFEGALHTIESFVTFIGQTAQLWANHTIEDNLLHEKLITNDYNNLKKLIEIDKTKVSADSIILLDKNATVLAQSGSALKKGDTLVSHDIVRETFSSKLSVTKIAREKESFIIYSSALIQKDNQTLGMLLIGYFINDIMLSNIKINEDLEIAFVGNSAIMSSTKWQGENELDVLPLPYINYQMLLSNPSKFQTIKYKNKSFVVSAKNLKNIDSSISGSILIGQLRTSIDELKEKTFFQTLLFLGIIFFFTLIILVLFTNKLISSISILKDTTAKIADGDLKNRVDIKTNDEFGILANNFNKMIDSIEMKNKELNKQNLLLEKEVEKRTKELLANEKVLFEQSKMASMGEMIGNIAHQWRQPLNLISTAASSINMKREFGVLEDKDIEETLDTILNTTKHLSKTIDDFRNLSNNTNEKSNFFIYDVINDSLELLLPRIKTEHIELIKNIDNSIEIHSSRRELMQGIMNIINNSIDVLSKENKEERLIFISLYKQSNKLVLVIKDNAGGINPNYLNKIFEPYFTTKHQSQGTGLGLHITYKIVTEVIGGKIIVENEEFLFKNKSYSGAKFSIEIPL